MPTRLSGGEHEGAGNERSMENARIIFLQECVEKEPSILRDLGAKPLSVWQQFDNYFKQTDFGWILQWANPSSWPDELFEHDSLPASQVRIAIRLCLASFHLEEDWIIETAFLTVHAWSQRRWPVNRWHFSGSYLKAEPFRAPELG